MKNPLPSRNLEKLDCHKKIAYKQLLVIQLLVILHRIHLCDGAF